MSDIRHSTPSLPLLINIPIIGPIAHMASHPQFSHRTPAHEHAARHMAPYMDRADFQYLSTQSSQPLGAQSHRQLRTTTSPLASPLATDRTKINFFYQSHSFDPPLQPLNPPTNTPHYEPPPQVTHPLQTNTKSSHNFQWQSNFISIYSTFEAFAQKFELILEELFAIEGQFEIVNDQESWSELRRNFNLVVETFGEMREQIIVVLDSNNKAVLSLSPETIQELERRGQRDRVFEDHVIEDMRQIGSNEETGEERSNKNTKSLQDNKHWQYKYFELLQQYEGLCQQAQQMKQALQMQGLDHETRIDYQNKINQLLYENQNRREAESKLNEAYAAAITHIKEQQQNGWDQEKTHRIIEGLHVELNNISEHKEYLQNQLEEQRSSFMSNMNEINEQLTAYQADIAHKSKQLEQKQQIISRLESIITIKNSSDQLVSDSRLQQNTRIIEQKDRIIAEIEERRDRLEDENKILREQAQYRERMLIDLREENQSLQNRLHASSINERKQQAEWGEISLQKSLKVRTLAQQIQSLNEQLQRSCNDKDRAISHMKQHISDQSEHYRRMIDQRDKKIKLQQDRIKSLQHQLTNKNLEISRVRYHSPTLSSTQDQQNNQHKKQSQRKNNQIQQMRKIIQNKGLSLKEKDNKIWELEEKINSLAIENNRFKRELNESLRHKGQMEILQVQLRKKKQEVYEMRLLGIQKQKMSVEVTNLYKQRQLLMSSLKDKQAECEQMSQYIYGLQRQLRDQKLHLNTNETSSPIKKGSNKSIASIDHPELDNKHTDLQIRRLNNANEILQTTIERYEISIKQLTQQRNILKQNNEKLLIDSRALSERLESQIIELNKNLRNGKQQNQQHLECIRELRSRLTFCETSLANRQQQHDKDITDLKALLKRYCEASTTAAVDLQNLNNKLQQSERQKQLIHIKIQQKQDRLEEKNRLIQQLRNKELQKCQDHQDTIRQLHEQIARISAKNKGLQQDLKTVNKKLQIQQSNNQQYKRKIFAEPVKTQPNLRALAARQQLSPRQVIQLDRFDLKDPESYDVFEKKVIYELKNEIDFLRSELAHISLNQSPNNRFYNTQRKLDILQEQLRKDQSPEKDLNPQLQNFFKNKNKELQQRAEQLIKVNKQLNDKLSQLATNPTNQVSIQFFKDQISKLEKQITYLQEKLKKLLEEHDVVKDEVAEYEAECDCLRKANKQLEKKSIEDKDKMRDMQAELSQLESTRLSSKAELEKLKNSLIKQKQQNNELSKKNNKTLLQLKKKSQTTTTLSHQNQALKLEIDRLAAKLKAVMEEKVSQSVRNEEQIQQLRQKIYILQISSLALDNAPFSDVDDMKYKIQGVRSRLVEADTLVGNITLHSQQDHATVSKCHSCLEQSLKLLKQIDLNRI